MTNPKMLLTYVRIVVTDSLAVTADWSSHTLQEAGDEMRKVISTKYPNLSNEALDALRWNYTYTYR